MPIMDLTIPAGTLDAGRREALVNDLTTALLRAERAPDTEFFRNITWVFVHEPEVFVAGRAAEQPLVRLEVTTPEGALSDRRRAELVEAATRLIAEATGIEDTLRIWVLCKEIAEGSWGAAGNVIQFQALKAAAAAEREQEGSASVA